MKLGAIYWTLSSLVFAGGLGLMITGAVMHRTTDERISFTETADNITALDISLKESTLELCSSEKADVCTIEFQNVRKNAYISEDNGVLSIHDTKRKFLTLFHFGFEDHDSKVIVTVPEAEYENVKIHLGLADDNVIRKLDCRDLYLSMGTGDLEIKKLDVSGAFTFNGGTGNVDMESLEVASRLEIDHGTGSIEIKDCRFDSDLSIDAGTGDFRCKDVTVLGNMDADLGSGDLKLENFTVEGSCEIDCGAGKIDVTKGKFHHIDIDGGAGKMNIQDTKLLGDVVIDQGAGSITIEIDGKATDYWLNVDQGAGRLESGGIPMGTPLKTNAHRIQIDGGAGDIWLSVKD